jgi:hypothetical protein
MLYIDLVARYVDDSGYLPMLLVNGREVWRGEYYDDLIEAITQCKGQAKVKGYIVE